MKKNRRKALGQILFYLLILAVLLLTVFPFLYMVLGAFKNTVDIVNPAKTFCFMPTMKNFVQVFEVYQFTKPLINSLIISFGATGLSLLIGLPASYSMARYRQNMLQIVVLCIRIVPSIAFLVPVYLMFSRVGLTGTYTGIILANMLIAVPFVVWVMIPYFEGVPVELEESALIDGASRMTCFLKIMLPLSRPGIITVTILSFINAWNNFMFGLILGNADTKILPTVIFNFLSHTEINWSGLMAAAIIVTLPIIILSIFLQKYIVQGMTAGAVKG